VPDATAHHLTAVLRYPVGEPVTYTDGRGSAGVGTWTGTGVDRGEEHTVDDVAPELTIAVAPPRNRDRQRFIVEKLQELAVQRLVWTSSARTEGRPPASRKADAWAVGALEQSRGARLMAISVAPLDDLTTGLLADPGGVPARTVERTRPLTMVVGPEGGLTDDERDRFHWRVALGSTILRTETAAIAAAISLRG
jgi:16S rRNA (uracil1498-N3)-methyltransferase